MSREKKRSLETDLVDSLLAEERNESAELSSSKNEFEDEGTSIPNDPPENSDENNSENTKTAHTSNTKTQRINVTGEEPQADDDTMQVTKRGRFEETSTSERTYVFGQEATQRLQGDASQKDKTEVRIGRLVSDKVVQGGGGPVSSVEASLAQSENLRVAQSRILELEKELERVRQENEQLMAAGETLRRKSDDLATRVEKAEVNLREERLSFKEEKKLYKESMEDKDRENMRLREKIEELELRLESDLKKIRVRERELENRLELVKMEEAALMRNKDEIILDLKRKIDQLQSEVENYRGRSLELHKGMEADQERLRRTVRTLRLALSMLEDGEISAVPLKKAE